MFLRMGAHGLDFSFRACRRIEENPFRSLFVHVLPRDPAISSFALDKVAIVEATFLKHAEPKFLANIGRRLAIENQHRPKPRPCVRSKLALDVRHFHFLSGKRRFSPARSLRLRRIGLDEGAQHLRDGFHDPVRGVDSWMVARGGTEGPCRLARIEGVNLSASAGQRRPAAFYVRPGGLRSLGRPPAGWAM